MFRTIFLLVFHAEFNTHIACTMAVENFFRFFVIISVREKSILKIEKEVFLK